MSSSHPIYAKAIHDPKDGVWYDATCAVCGHKANHSEKCEIGKAEKEALEQVEKLKIQDAQ